MGRITTDWSTPFANPEKPGRYQIAFGHRRVRALASLGRPVRAVVQPLTDEELVVIQGQENSARADLSYIERGLFALALEQGGFDRKVIMAALSMEKTQASKLMSVMHAVPRALAEAIGPAPKAGRPRWEALAERLRDSEAASLLDRVIAAPGFVDLDSDTRFARVFSALAPRPAARQDRTASVLKDDNGRTVATIAREGPRLTMVIDEREAPEFGAYIADRLPALLKAFQREKESLGDEPAD